MGNFEKRLVQVVPSQRQLEWQKLEFTCFFHYGMNSFTDREWGDGTAECSIFCPNNLDTDQWCESIKEAGARACIITAKHHDGFCLWNTEYTDYCVKNTPFGRDIVNMLSRSCKKYGIKLGIYLSPWDRHEKTYGYGKAYDDYFCGQLTELLSEYGEIYTVWLDGACGEGTNGKKQKYDWQRYYAVIRKLMPQAVISICGPDVRWCGNEAGVCRKSEWSVVPASLFNSEKIQQDSQKEDDEKFREQTLKSGEEDLGSRNVVAKANELIWYPAEVDTSIRPGWFYHKEEDNKVKSLSKLISIYLDSVGGNSVLLLNIPPHPDGYITEYDRKRLKELGSFLTNTFRENLLKGAKISASSEELGAGVEHILTEDENFWKAEEEAKDCAITIEWETEKAIRYILLMEQIMLSQRIEEFEIFSFEQGEYQRIYKGSTVGYKKICKLTKPCYTKKIKIQFTEVRVCPTLKYLGIYRGE